MRINRLTSQKRQLIINMKMKNIVIRVSNFLLDHMHEFCKRENITYSELFEQAIQKLIEKYLPEESYEQKDTCGSEDRDDC